MLAKQHEIAFCMHTDYGNNIVTHASHTAVTGGGNDSIFEYNTINHACFETIDTGAFYVGRSWSQLGNVARFNIFNTVRPTEKLVQKSNSYNAFYLDDQMSGWKFCAPSLLTPAAHAIVFSTFIQSIVPLILAHSHCSIECTWP
jgi:hypothetical protein